MDVLRNLCLPKLEGFFKALTPLPQPAQKKPDLQLQVIVTEQAIEPKPVNEDEQDDSSSDSSEEECIAKPEAMRAIPDLAFKEILLKHIDPEEDLDPRYCEIIHRTEGSFNHCAIVQCRTKGYYAIKVPARGTEALWTDADASSLRSEVLTMKYIRHHTNIPVPEIHGWDNTLNNYMGAPYIVMSCAKGKPAWGLWVATDPDGCADFQNIDSPTPDHEKLRHKLLQNLANIMAELRTLQFDKAGMLHFDEDADTEGTNPPSVGDYFQDVGTEELKQHCAYSSTAEYLNKKLDQLKEGFGGEGEITEEIRGVMSFYRSVVEAFPSAKTGEDEAETFVLAHPDLDLQNVFVDDDANITGIIDWQGVRAVPRPLGYAALPLFLRKDFDTDYSFGGLDGSPWCLEQYREVYARYMKEALGDSSNDGILTLKSGLYHAASEAMDWRGGAGEAFIQRMFKAIPSLHAVEVEAFLTRLGSDEGWQSAETMLARELKKLFSP